MRQTSRDPSRLFEGKSAISSRSAMTQSDVTIDYSLCCCEDLRAISAEPQTKSKSTNDANLANTSRIATISTIEKLCEDFKQ